MERLVFWVQGARKISSRGGVGDEIVGWSYWSRTFGPVVDAKALEERGGTHWYPHAFRISSAVSNRELGLLQGKKLIAFIKLFQMNF